MTDTVTQSNLGKERVDLAYVLVQSSRDHGGTALTGLLPMEEQLLLADSLWFSQSVSLGPRTTFPGMTPPTVGWALLHQSLIENAP